MSTNNQLTISEGSPILHYGQGAFEGMKAYRTKDGQIQLFRPDRNAKRMQDSAEKLLMPSLSVERFVDAAKQVVAANNEYVPPYGTGATLYLRPTLIGVGDNIGVSPATEYIFTILPCRLDLTSRAAWSQRGSLWPINSIAPLILGPGKARLAGITRPAYRPASLPMRMVMGMPSTWIR